MRNETNFADLCHHLGPWFVALENQHWKKFSYLYICGKMPLSWEHAPFNFSYISMCKLLDTQSFYAAGKCWSKRKWGNREGHWGCWLGYVVSTEVFFSFGQKRKSFSPDFHMIPFARWSVNFVGAVCTGICFIILVEALKEPQPLKNKNAGCTEKYHSLFPENLNQRKQRWQQERLFFAFVWRTTCKEVSYTYCSIL